MALEQSFLFAQQSFIANGTIQGLVKVLDASGFYVKQLVTISSGAAPSIVLQIKRVNNSTDIIVGPQDEHIKKYSDVSAYLVADGATITAFEQIKPRIKPDEIINAVYEKDPAVAIRSILVDKFGTQADYIKDNNGKNRLAVDVGGSINIDNLTVDIASPQTPDIQNVSALLANTEYSIALPINSKRFLLRDRDGDVKIKMAFGVGETATKYITISSGCNYNSGDIDSPAPLTIYFTTSKPNRVLELLSWS